MAAGISAKLWSINNIVELVENWETEQRKAKWGR
jgi:hypothetical protein